MLTSQVRNVVSRYIEDPDQGSSSRNRDKTWMEYEKDKNQNEPVDRDTQSVLNGVKDEFTPGGRSKIDNQEENAVSYNPYDYKDPSSKPKSLGDGGPVINDVSEINGPAYFTRPSIFKEDGPLYEWMKSRREDWTADPAQQSPAMSLDRRFASSAQRVVSLFLLSDIPIPHSVQVKTAASLLQIDNMFRGGDSVMYQKTYQRSQAVSDINWVNQNNKDQLTRGLYQFLVPSSSGKEPYNVYLQFLRTKNKKETPQGYLDFDVELSCSCDSFLFFGAQYYAVQGKYIYMPGFRASLLPPHPRTQTVSITKSTREQLTGEEVGVGRKNMGKGLNFRLCKHLMKVLDFVRDNLRVDEQAARKNYPLVGRPSYIINKDKWEEVFKFPFTLEEVQKQLTSGLRKVPNFYKTVYTREKGHYDKVDEWVSSVFDTLPPSQKTAYFRFLVEHPEEIFYILWRHAVDIYPDKIDPTLVSTGFRLMDKTIKSKSEQEPEKGVDQKGKNVYTGPNMTGVIPPSSMSEDTKDTPAPGKTPTTIGAPGVEKQEKKENKPAIKEKKEPREQKLKGKRIPKAIRDKRLQEKATRGVRKTDITNEI